MNMFKKKVTLEDFEEFKNEVEAELGRLRKEVKALQRKAGFKKLDWSNVKTDTQKSPKPFFMKVLEHLYESDDVRYFEGKFINEDGEVIAERIDDEPLKVAQPFISAMFAKLFPPHKRVERGFYHRAAHNGVLYKDSTNPRGDYHLTTIAMSVGNYVGALTITNEFLEEYKNKK